MVFQKIITWKETNMVLPKISTKKLDKSMKSLFKTMDKIEARLCNILHTKYHEPIDTKDLQLYPLITVSKLKCTKCDRIFYYRNS